MLEVSEEGNGCDLMSVKCWVGVKIPTGVYVVIAARHLKKWYSLSSIGFGLLGQWGLSMMVLRCRFCLEFIMLSCRSNPKIFTFLGTLSSQILAVV
jgi:hypothetical protein